MDPETPTEARRAIRLRDKIWMLPILYGSPWICDVCYEGRCWHHSEEANRDAEYEFDAGSECICACHDIAITQDLINGDVIFLPEEWFSGADAIPAPFLRRFDDDEEDQLVSETESDRAFINDNEEDDDASPEYSQEEYD